MRFQVISWRAPATFTVDRLATACSDAGLTASIVGMGMRSALRRALASAAKKAGFPQHDIKRMDKDPLTGWRYQLSSVSNAGDKLEYRPLCIVCVQTSLYFEHADPPSIADLVRDAFQNELNNQTSSFADNIVRSAFHDAGKRLIPFCRACIVEADSELTQKLERFFATLGGRFVSLMLDETPETRRGVASVLQQHAREMIAELREKLDKDGVDNKSFQRAADIIAYLKCFREVLEETSVTIAHEVVDIMTTMQKAALVEVELHGA